MAPPEKLNRPTNAFNRGDNATVRRLVLMASTISLFLSNAGAHPGSGIAVDPQGRVFFTAGPMIVMIETNGTARIVVHDRKNEFFYQLHHIQRAPDGGLLTASDMGRAIWRFSADGLQKRFYPPPNDDRPVAVGSGGDPFAVDRNGAVYAVNWKQNRFTQILKLTADGQVSVLAGGAWGYADGRGIEARFGFLHASSMLVLSNLDLLITDNSTRVRRITPDGTVSTVAGGIESGHTDGPALSARFDGVAGLAVDAQGNLLLVEESGWIRSVTPAGMVSTLAGSGKRGSVDGPLLQTSFDEPTGIAVAANGDLFVLEPGVPRVRKISGGKVTTLCRGLPAD